MPSQSLLALLCFLAVSSSIAQSTHHSANITPSNLRSTSHSVTNSLQEEIISANNPEASNAGQIIRTQLSTNQFGGVDMTQKLALEESDKPGLGSEILHIFVMIVIVLGGIGAVVAIIAILAYLYSYFRRKFYVHGGRKRAGSEHILLQDNTHDFALSSSIRKPSIN